MKTRKKINPSAIEKSLEAFLTKTPKKQELPQAPKLSIITASYNQANFIERTINSISNQESTIAEHIIIDGLSTDATKGILKSNDDHISYWVSEKDSGQTNAINKGLLVTKGDWSSHGRQTGIMLERVEEVFLELKPDIVLVYGDTNSTLAGALAAVKLHIPVAHVEAGLRSFNRKMPEEINRLVADHLSSFLFCPTDAAVENLKEEGITGGVDKVGDVMYDSVLFNTQLAEKNSDIIARLKLIPKNYYLATIHRAENTDEPLRLKNIIKALMSIDTRIILPLHPRTRKTLGSGLKDLALNVTVIDPISYLDMLMLEKNSRVILTDSGGVQKEAHWFNVPCITLRDETEWVELVMGGFNQVVGTDPEKICRAVQKAENTDVSSWLPSLYGDGKAAERIVEILATSSK